MKLIIAEKPELGAAIAAAIDGSESRENRCIKKGEYVIIWAFGHLLKLKEPAEYDPKYASKYDPSLLPIYFQNWELVPKPDDKEGKGMSSLTRLKQIKHYIDAADMVINAGDPDDEGQFLIDEILDWADCTKPVYRLKTGDTSESGLRYALKHLEDNKSYEPMGQAAYARSVSDLLIGINVSRHFSIQNQPAYVTIGRVQSPTLGLVVARDAKIEGHKKVEYYAVTADMSINGETVSCKYEPAEGDTNLTDGRILSEAYARQKVEMLQDKVFDDVSITEKMERVNPPLPFDLAALQTYCGKKYGLTPIQVMEVTQSLREKYGAITYNRSECRYLYDTQYEEAPATMASVLKNINRDESAFPGFDIKRRSKAFNNEKASAASHSGIIPQNKRLDISKMTKDEQNVYKSIVKYYIAQFMPHATKRKTQLEVGLPDGGKLKATSTTLVDEGFMMLLRSDRKDEEEEESSLSSLRPGAYHGEIIEAKSTKKTTNPPQRYTQYSLLDDMAHVAKYVDDPEIKKILIEKDKNVKDASGSIGTPATRAAIIANLIKRGYLEEDKKNRLRSTPLARELIRVLPDELKKPDITAYWWSIQQEIKAGEKTADDLISHVYGMVEQIVKTDYPKIDQSIIPVKGKDGATREILGTCPKCGGSIVEGKQGFGCSGWRNGCKFVIWKNPKTNWLSQTTFTKADAKRLLSGGAVKKSKLIGKNGEFEAKLRLKDEPDNPYVNFALEFEKRRRKK